MSIFRRHPAVITGFRPPGSTGECLIIETRLAGDTHNGFIVSEGGTRPTDYENEVKKAYRIPSEGILFTLEVKVLVESDPDYHKIFDEENVVGQVIKTFLTIASYKLDL